jgi:ferrochelatase
MANTAPIGVLMVNVGTPSSASVADVRRFLREFLSDPRVVEVPRALWLPLLHLVILPLRSRKSAHAYAQVWMEDGSPLAHFSRMQRDLLSARLGAGFVVELGMRYGEPSIARAVETLCAAGCERLVLLPMFPQYSRATTGSVSAETMRVVAERQARPGLAGLAGLAALAALATVAPWFEDEGYIAALAESIASAAAERAAMGRAIDHWVFSFHGIPRRYVEGGDPYRDHCERTAHALAARLDLDAASWSLTYQSRFGREPWLEPYTDVHVPLLARGHANGERARRVLIAMPGFVADCLETLEEIGMRLAKSFRAAGGEELVVVPALNESPRLADALASLVRRST